MDIPDIIQQMKDLMIECAKECGADGVVEGNISFSGDDAKEKALACKKLFEERRNILLTRIRDSS
jgi:hypothetical protein